MKFLISMSDVEDEWDGLPEAERERVGALHEEFQRALGDRFVCCYGVMPSHEARTVRRDANGGFEVRKGPITETREPLGGFYIIEADSVDEAVEWARKGRFRAGANEVRQIREG